MYNLDINFLRDRGIEQTVDLNNLVLNKDNLFNSKKPILIGAIVALIAPALTFGYLQSIKSKTAKLETEIKQLETEIAALGVQNQKLEAVNQEIKQLETETTAFIQVFENVKSWAAIMQEVSDRTPPGVLVDSIQQSAGATPTPTPATTAKNAPAATPAPPPATGINIAGVARSYNDINDFVLFLSRSPFFDGKQIKLNGASLTSFPVEVANQEDLPENVSLEIPQGVKYTISAPLNNIPSSQLIKEISEKGSIGLVTRLKTLQSTGESIK
ncbi:hypothetical protein NIES4102_06680 [Chondrocystis sp. NIES-4102]|nr:hypothetical protein NIES4102_06680 [Chondrocystis sp. NIES-4102]